LHVGEQIGLSQLAIFRTWRTDACCDFILDQIGQTVLGAIAGGGLDGKIPVFVRSCDTAANKEQVDFMPFALGNFRKPETSGSRLIVILAQHKREICHFALLY
jgi:hypothetical protein